MPTGRIKYYNSNKGFGFIAQDSNEEDVFLHNSAIKHAEYEELRVGQRVKYNVVEGEKGLVAKNVEVLLTATERRWLRQGKTIIPRGYSGFPAQNQGQLFNENEPLPDKTDPENKAPLPKTASSPGDKPPKTTSLTSPTEPIIEGREQTSKRLSFGDLYILKQINFETPMFFALYNYEQLPATVLEMTLSTFTLNCNGKEQVIPKTDVKYCYKDIDAENLRALLHYSEEVKARQLKATASPEENYVLDAETTQHARKEGNSIRVILREGEIFQGTVDWISPYEIKMVLENGSKVVVFRHALYDFSVIPMES